MNTDVIEGRWHQIIGRLRSEWGRLTDDDVAEINGDRERLLGKLQARYGLARDEAERKIRKFEQALEESGS